MVADPMPVLLMTKRTQIDQQWVTGVVGKLHLSSWSSTPSGTIYISREYDLAQEAQVQVSNSILQAEQSLKGKLPDSPQVEVLSSWLQLIQRTLLFLNETHTLPNVSHCFLCTSLQRSLLAAVPLTTSPRTQGKGECQPPVAGIPLCEPETPEPTLPPRICYQTSNPVIGGRVTWNCTQNYIASSHTKASLAPCLLKFIHSRIAEMSRVTVNQLLLHPYTRLPSDLPLPNPGL
ncbi:endogenous retrovirus group FC1 Env polyprotein-like [Myotis lucifugus]|uniref:endogenous retrovirus group FC1 Env polyprotein-like n=1 Tax=Myotis lucifugus TaxID=59463 RepID=UPI000CCBEA28|nr:endogenous retrovirus group FC1 Env polyprotein-like [Myotis lucifugus]